MLRRLIYVSRPTQDLSARAIPTIIATARARNPQDQITGVLLFTGLDFAQLIEGPTPAIDALWGRIRADARHTDIAVVLDEPASSRWCTDWRVGFPSDGALLAQITKWRVGAGAADPSRAPEYRHVFEACDAI